MERSRLLVFPELGPLVTAAVSVQRNRGGIRAGLYEEEDRGEGEVIAAVVRHDAEHGIDWVRGGGTLPPEPDLVLEEEVGVADDKEKGFEIKPEDDATVELPAITREQLEERVKANKALEDAARQEYEEEAPRVTVGEPRVRRTASEAAEPKRDLKSLLTELEQKAAAETLRATQDARRFRADLERNQRLARVCAILAGAWGMPEGDPFHGMDRAEQVDWALKMERTIVTRGTGRVAVEDLVFKTRRELNAEKQKATAQPKSSEPFSRGGA